MAYPADAAKHGARDRLIRSRTFEIIVTPPSADGSWRTDEVVHRLSCDGVGGPVPAGGAGWTRPPGARAASRSTRPRSPYSLHQACGHSRILPELFYSLIGLTTGVS